MEERQEKGCELGSGGKRPPERGAGWGPSQDLEHGVVIGGCCCLLAGPLKPEVGETGFDSRQRW